VQKKGSRGSANEKKAQGGVQQTKRLKEECKQTGSANEKAQGGTNTLRFAFLLRNSTFGVWKKSQLSWVNPGIQGEMPSD
jgi:hypothetical protein